jgi:hypothetical protein
MLRLLPSTKGHFIEPAGSFVCRKAKRFKRKMAIVEKGITEERGGP